MKQKPEWIKKNEYFIVMEQEANILFNYPWVEKYLRTIVQSKNYKSVSETKFNFKKLSWPDGTFIAKKK
jgi:hypothetical protein